MPLRARWRVGWENAWEQEKLEAREMLLEAAESHPSAARCVGRSH